MRGKLMCPKYCRTALAQVTVGKTEVDQCPKCEGIWFDSGVEGDELVKVLRVGYDNLPEQLKKSWNEDQGRITWHMQTKYNCPRCGCELAAYWYRPKDGRVFRVNGCLKNGCGFWLDDGELKLAHDLIAFVEPELLAARDEATPPGIVHRILRFFAGRQPT